MNTAKIVILARKHVGNGAAMESSARLCLSEAMQASERHDLQAMREWAIKSLRYSVGIFHKDYQSACNLSR